MEKLSIDREVRDLLEAGYRAALGINANALDVSRRWQVYTPDQIKMMIIATNLEALAKTLIMDEVEMDMKKVALGVLGCVDWIRESF